MVAAVARPGVLIRLPAGLALILSGLLVLALGAMAPGPSTTASAPLLASVLTVPSAATLRIRWLQVSTTHSAPDGMSAIDIGILCWPSDSQSDGCGAGAIWR